jgi:hypothetical protein
MKSRTRSRKPASIGSNHSSRRPTAISASEPRTGNFVLLLVMAWSPPAHNAGIVWVSAPGDYATFNSNHTPDGTYAAGNEFRTTPLWGVGQRVFFLHDGRTTDLLSAIVQHASPGSEANGSITKFLGLAKDQQQAILNFLRSL